MKTYLSVLSLSLLAACLFAVESRSLEGSTPVGPDDELMRAQPRLIRITAVVDGSDKISFARNWTKYEHRQWSPLQDVTFEGSSWSDLTKTPPAWLEMADRLDLSRAWIVKRQGRDMIALEHTLEGFDLYLCDSPNGSSSFEVTIAIPQR